ncbi:MAG: hypothetical protein LKI24_07905 [Acidipropionibacterium sp.]|nr:hypothetical protein [Acidipropionibacterium sp.]
MGASEFRCPKCALDLHLAGSVRLTDPALDALLPGHAQAPGGSSGALSTRISESEGRAPSPEDAVTRLLPAVGDADATRVMPLTGSVGRADAVGSAGSADDQMTQVLGRIPAGGRASSTAGSAAGDSPRLLNPPPVSAGQAAPGPWQGGSTPGGSTPSSGLRGADENLPREWFRDPQAEYDGALGAPASGPAPVFNPPARPKPAPAPAPAPVKKDEGRRVGPVLVAMLVVTVLVLIGVVWWVLSNLTSKAEGQIRPLDSDTVAAAGLVSGAASPAPDPSASSDSLDAA